MASDREYLDYILDQLSLAPEITFRSMMGEYILYTRGRVFGGIYDNRFLVKPVPAAAAMMPDAVTEIPYEGAKGKLGVTATEDRNFLRELVMAMYEELPPPGKRKTAGKRT
ncbi:TfoX/Sxy family protein [Succinimonas amylolytica]|uniref:TfoX/Sxy family protein n=1 Tax=Succinimonas amylolytica TaxID=83769 RepID=UPI00037995FD|nr:TfoX/Sxy family protein [Succinimonas amylolytica]